MNQRIKELVEQATTKVEYYPPSRNGYPEYRYDFDREKFAELIVKECAGVVANAVDHREPASTYVDKIKKHFGVSE